MPFLSRQFVLLFALAILANTARAEAVDSTAPEVVLTQSEKAFIDAHPVIRLGIDPEFRPFEFVDDEGEYRGYAGDYIKLLNERLGINMQVVSGLSWAQVIEKAKTGDIDVLPAVGKTMERQAFLDFSDPYVEFHRVIITRTEMPFLRGMDDLKNLRVGVQKDSSHHGFINDTSIVQPIPFETLQDTLLAVANGEVDAMVGNIAASAYWIRRMNLTNLKVAAAASDQTFELHFAVRKDWPELTSIISKGLKSITDKEKETIADRWMVLKYDPDIDYETIVLIVMCAALIIMLVLAWNAHLRTTNQKIQLAKDETEKANRDLAEMRDHLENMVIKRTSELLLSEKQFQQAQKMEALGTLVGGVAHDFNNLLAGLLGIISLAQLEVDEESEIHSQLQDANDLGFRGAQMIKELLSFARNNNLEKQYLDMGMFLKNITPIIRTSIPGTIELTITQSELQIPIIGNDSLIEQALLNILNNARDAVQNEELARIFIDLDVYENKDADDQPRIPDLTYERYARIQITDNGSGMDEVTCSRIFEPFFSTKPAEAGTGLGLAQVYGTVQSHAGHIEVDSELGLGTTFSIYLPLTDHQEVANLKNPEVHRGSGQTILMADDDKTVRSIHKSLLESLGYNVITANDGEEALDIYGRMGADIDLVLLDVIMPRRNGISTARVIRAAEPHQPIVFLSGHDDTGYMPSYLEQNQETLLEKPCTLSVLSKTIADSLERSST